MFGALSLAFEAWLLFIILVVNVSANFKPKRTAAPSRGFLARAQLSCLHYLCLHYRADYGDHLISCSDAVEFHPRQTCSVLPKTVLLYKPRILDLTSENFPFHFVIGVLLGVLGGASCRKFLGCRKF